MKVRLLDIAHARSGGGEPGSPFDQQRIGVAEDLRRAKAAIPSLRHLAAFHCYRGDDLQRVRALGALQAQRPADGRRNRRSDGQAVRPVAATA